MNTLTESTLRSRQWRVPAALILLGLIPLIAGAARLSELTGGAAVTPDNMRFFDSPVPVLTHIVSVTVYVLLGAFQFVPSLRGRRRWHRRAGRVLIPAGLLAALSGLWMSAFYDLPASDGVALLVLRLLFGSAMVASILLGLAAMLRRDFARHGAWMTRAYAIALGAGTQALILLPVTLIFGATDQGVRAVFMGAGWVINLGVAEVVIRRRQATRRASGTATPMMRAAVIRKFGPPEVVRVEEIPKPKPGRGEILIRVHASTVSAADYRSRTRDIPRGLAILAAPMIGIFAPRHRVLGMDVAGVVDAVGADVSKFAPGDEVIAMLGGRFGGHAEFVSIPQTVAIAARPGNLSSEEAVALVFGGITARDFLNLRPLKPGDSVLINGASGAVGSAAVQLAKQAGTQVTGVCSTANLDLVARLGADRVIDYTNTDFALEGKTYDVIVDCVGNAPFERVEASVAPGGALLLVIADLKAMLGAAGQSRRSGKLVAAGGGKYTAADLEYLVELAEAGLLRPVIDRSYPLSEIAEAHRYVATGRKKGSVVLRIAGSEGITLETIEVEAAVAAAQSLGNSSSNPGTGSPTESSMKKSRARA